MANEQQEKILLTMDHIAMRALERSAARYTNLGEKPMVDQDSADPQFNATTARLLRREALRRAAKELSTMTLPGLENAVARISSEVTQEAALRRANASGKAHGAGVAPGRKLPGQA